MKKGKIEIELCKNGCILTQTDGEKFVCVDAFSAVMLFFGDLFDDRGNFEVFEEMLIKKSELLNGQFKHIKITKETQDGSTEMETPK